MRRGLVTQLWRDWFTGISLALFGFAAGGGGGVIMQTGTSTSDPAGAIAVTLPVPFNVRTLSFQVNAAPTEPNAYLRAGHGQCAAARCHHRAAGARTLAAAALSRCRIPTSPGSPRACDAVDTETAARMIWRRITEEVTMGRMHRTSSCRG